MKKFYILLRSTTDKNQYKIDSVEGHPVPDLRCFAYKENDGLYTLVDSTSGQIIYKGLKKYKDAYKVIGPETELGKKLDKVRKTDSYCKYGSIYRQLQYKLDDQKKEKSI